MPSCALQCTIPACACAKMESVQAWVSRARDRYTRTGPSESGPDFFPVTLGMERQQGEDSMKRCWGWEKGGLGHEADFGGQLLHTLTKTLGAFCPSGPGLALSSLASLGRCRLGVGWDLFRGFQGQEAFYPVNIHHSASTSHRLSPPVCDIICLPVGTADFQTWAEEELRYAYWTDGWMGGWRNEGNNKKPGRGLPSH